MQVFTDEERIKQFQQREAGNCQNFYVLQIRLLSTAAHGLKEPFSLLAKDIPPPDLPPELDELAQKRALQYFRLLLLLKGDYLLFQQVPERLLSDDICIAGRRSPVTPDFICAIIHWLTLYQIGDHPLPREWSEDMKAYLKARWPSYNGQEVTQELLTYWMIDSEKLDRQAMPPLLRFRSDVKTLVWRIRGILSFMLLMLRVGLKRMFHS